MPVPIFALQSVIFLEKSTFVEKAEHALEKARIIQ